MKKLLLLFSIVYVSLSLCATEPDTNDLEIEYRTSAEIAGVEDTFDLPLVAAHRGAWFDAYIPENSLVGVDVASKLGYKAVEMDPRYTSDSVLVIMHDLTLNRTMRNASDYSQIDEPVYLKDITFEELRNNYVMASSNPNYRVFAPTLEEMLECCKEKNIKVILHSSIPKAYEMAHTILGENWIGFSGNIEVLKAAREYSDVLMLHDPGNSNLDVLKKLASIGGRVGCSTMRTEFLTKEFCHSIRNAGCDVQASVFRNPYDGQAIENGVSYLLTDFVLPFDQTSEPSFSWNKNSFGAVGQSITLNDGEVLFEKLDKGIGIGGLIVEIKFSGKVRIELNNSSTTYDLESVDVSTKSVSLRFAQSMPEVKITALESSTIEDLVIDIYDIGVEYIEPSLPEEMASLLPAGVVPIVNADL